MGGFSFAKCNHPESQHLGHLIYLILNPTFSQRALIRTCSAWAEIIPQEVLQHITHRGSVSTPETFPHWFDLVPEDEMIDVQLET